MKTFNSYNYYATHSHANNAGEIWKQNLATFTVVCKHTTFYALFFSVNLIRFRKTLILFRSFIVVRSYWGLSLSMPFPPSLVSNFISSLFLSLSLTVLLLFSIPSIYTHTHTPSPSHLLSSTPFPK